MRIGLASIALFFASALCNLSAQNETFEISYIGYIPSPPESIQLPSSDHYITIAAGYYHSFGLRDDGTLAAWGANSDGVLNIPQGLEDVVSIATGGTHAVALRKDGTLVAWGNNDFGQLDVPPTLNGVKAISAGENHTLALKHDGSVVAWGDNSSGQLNIPANLTGIKAIAAGIDDSVILTENGTLQIWGRNQELVKYFESVSNIVAIDCHDSPLVLTEDGYALDPYWGVMKAMSFGWGFSHYETNSIPLEYFPIVLATDCSLVATGKWFTLYASKDGRVGAFGFGFSQSDKPSSLYVPDNLKNVTALDTGTHHALALDAHGRITQWEYIDLYIKKPAYGLKNIMMLRVYGSYVTTVMDDGKVLNWDNQGLRPVPADLENVIDVSINDRTALALKSDGTLVYWQHSTLFDLEPNYIPPEVNDLATIDSGSRHTVALKKDGTVIAWGDNTKGQTNVPVDLSDVVSIEVGEDHNIALKSNGTVVAWGTFDDDQSSHAAASVVPENLSGVVAIAAGDDFVLALKNDGSLVAWGNNESGQLDFPTEATGVMQVAAGSRHAVALKMDGTVIAWGNNGWGQTNIPSNLQGVIGVDAGPYSTIFHFAAGTLTKCLSHKVVFREPFFPNLGNDFVYGMNTQSFFYIGLCPFVYDFKNSDWWYVFEGNSDPNGFWIYSYNESKWKFVLKGFVIEFKHAIWWEI